MWCDCRRRPRKGNSVTLWGKPRVDGNESTAAVKRIVGKGGGRKKQILRAKTRSESVADDAAASKKVAGKKKPREMEASF